MYGWIGHIGLRFSASLRADIIGRGVPGCQGARVPECQGASGPP